MLHFSRLSIRQNSLLILVLSVQLAVLAGMGTPCQAQQTPPGVNVSQAELESLASDAKRAATNPRPSSNVPKTEEMNFLSLLVRGGWFMVPIGLLSLLVVTVAFERALALRANRLIPHGLVRAIGALARENETLDPKAAYRLCQQFPSSAANVIRTMLLKTGRPHAEIESAIREASQREADRAYSGVRWLSLAAGLAPLLGLLGTVWGLMRSFHDLGQIGPSQNRGQYLAQGIYEALITTLGGLIVAIAASFLAHYFEGKIILAFRKLEELMFHLMTQIEPFEGKVRFDAIGKDLVATEKRSSEVTTPSSEASGGPHATRSSATSPAVSLTSKRIPSSERRESRGT